MRFILNDTESINSMDWIQQAKKAGSPDSNSIIECVYCDFVFPKEYDKCPQCEVDKLWYSIKIQFDNNFGGKQK